MRPTLILLSIAAKSDRRAVAAILPRAEPVRLRFRVLLLFGVAAVASPVSLAVLGVQFFARRYGTGGRSLARRRSGSLARSRVATRRRRRGYR